MNRAPWIPIIFFVGIFSLPNSAYADPLAVQSTTPVTSQIPNVGLIWKGDIPTSVAFPSDAYSGTVEFPIQGLLPFKVLADKATGVEVDFEIWSPLGKKLGSQTIYSFSWNPVGPNTLVDISLYPDNSLYGTQTLIIKTIYTTTTSGLLSRYLEDDQQFPIQINKVIPPKAPEPPSLSNSTTNGTTFNFNFSVPDSSPPVTKYEVAMASLLSPNLSPTSSFSFGTKTILLDTASTSFSITPADVIRYFASGYATLGTSSVLFTVRAVNAVGSSNWSNGIYIATADLGLGAYGAPTPQSVPSTPYTVDVPPLTVAHNATKLITIKCTNGKSFRNVKAVNPRCPTGFKRK